MQKKRKKLIIWIIAAVILLVIILVGMQLCSGGKSNTGPATVKVSRTNIVDKALAVGNIEPINEIAVKSKISGVVRTLYANVGDFVRLGDLLLEIKPDPTPLELAEAKRNIELAAIEMDNLEREFERQKQLKEKGLVSDTEYESMRRQYSASALQHKIAEEHLELIEKGKVRIAETDIETTIKAPITGFILEKSVNVGDPVVPLTSYQAGTELLKMADMDQLIFRGTVDEIDVGKIQEGMPTELQIGALPGKSVTGQVSLISLKARREENTTVFPIEIIIQETGDAVLRAGFSANANIIIAKKDSVLSVPERVVTFRNDSAFVRIVKDVGESEEIFIKTGLSDAINIEVINGLEEGQEVLEKEIREII